MLLAVLPVMVYLASFRVHFWALSNTGSGDGFMSMEFQQSLYGTTPMQDTAAGLYIWSRLYRRLLR